MLNFKDLIDDKGHASIPAGTVKIARHAFNGCSTLVTVDIPSDVKEIGISAFKGCRALKEITIPEGVTEIPESAFFGCESLARVTLPSSITIIGTRAFAGCKSLKNLTIPKGITRINDSTFEPTDWRGGAGLETIVIPEGVTVIGNLAFHECRDLVSITLPDSLERIGAKAFEGCSKLASIDIPNNVKTIGKDAFALCTSLQSIVIPDRVKEIIKGTLGGCYNLHLSLPSSLEHISVDNIRGVKQLSIPSDNPFLRFCDGCLVDKETLALLYMLPTAQHFPEGIREIGIREKQSIPLPSPNSPYYSEYAVKKTLKEWKPQCNWCPEIPLALDNEELVIPDGVEFIEYLPIYKSHIRHLVLPASLKKVFDNFFVNSCLDTVTLSSDLFLSDEFKGWKAMVKVNLTGMDSIDDDMLARIKAKCDADKSLYVFFKGEIVYPSESKYNKKIGDIQAKALAQQRKDQEIEEQKRKEKEAAEKKRISEQLEDEKIKEICDAISNTSVEVYRPSNNRYLRIIQELPTSDNGADKLELRCRVELDNAKESAEMLSQVSSAIRSFMEKFNMSPAKTIHSPFLTYQCGGFICRLRFPGSSSFPCFEILEQMTNEFKEMFDSLNQKYSLDRIYLYFQ